MNEEELMNKEEREQYQKDLDKYLKAYPYLREPVAHDMLNRSIAWRGHEFGGPFLYSFASLFDDSALVTGA
jgi:hypothetical protein